MVVRLIQIVNTLKANAVFKIYHSNGIAQAFMDNEYVKEFRLDIILFQRDLD